jgi:hypothetical protein
MAYLFPRLTFYVDELPKGVAGRANGPIIRILKSNREDHRLWMHEYEHVRQFWKLFWLFGLGHLVLYKLCRPYRYWAEARAYAVQTKEDKSDLLRMAMRLASPGDDHYNLNTTILDAGERIEAFIDRKGFEP